MYIKISAELQKLADIFEKNKETLYIVGGHVRDAILGLKSTLKNDVDLCSACKPEKVCKILANTGFKVDSTYAHLGKITIEGQNAYEYTSFRRENYFLNGEHNPTGIEFVKDINLDARRRDFSINAVYYNINTGDLVDPVDGVSDIKNGVIRTTINSTQSFKEDSERILRMIRFACSFGFDIEEKTLRAALEQSNLLANLSKTRIRKELDKMLVCDMIYPTLKQSEFAHARCFILLGQLDLLKYILPALDSILDSDLKDAKGELLYEHIIKTLSVCSPKVRLACLFHDVGKMYTKTRRKNFEFSSDWADIIIEANIGIDGLGYPKKEVEEIKKIVKALDWDNGNKSKKQIREFIREYFDVFDKVCLLKDAIALENTKFTNKSKIAARWKTVYNKMVELNTPLKLSDLKIDGNHIKNKLPQIKLNKIGKLLSQMLDFCLHHPKYNETEILLHKVQKIAQKNPNLYFE